MTTTFVAIGAVLLLVLTLQDAFEVMLLPRRVARQVRFVGFFYRATWAAWCSLAARLPRNGRSEQFLSVYGALSMVLLFGLWIIGLILGFGLLFWAAQTGSGGALRPSLGSQIYLAGLLFFTLG